MLNRPALPKEEENPFGGFTCRKRDHPALAPGLQTHRRAAKSEATRRGFPVLRSLAGSSTAAATRRRRPAGRCGPAPPSPRKPLRSPSLIGRRRPRRGSPPRARRRTLLALGWRGLERRSAPCHVGKHPVACSGNFVGVLLAAAVRD